jgi:hypothetical protein
MSSSLSVLYIKFLLYMFDFLFIVLLINIVLFDVKRISYNF